MVIACDGVAVGTALWAIADVAVGVEPLVEWAPPVPWVKLTR